MVAWIRRALVLLLVLAAPFASASNDHGPAPVAIDVQHVIVAVGAPIQLRAKVSSLGSGYAGAHLQIAVAGTSIKVQAVSTVGGLAHITVPYPNNLAVGQYAIGVSFAGDPSHRAATANGQLSVLKSATSMGGAFSTIAIPPSAPTQWYEDVKVDLLRTTDNAGLAGRTVSFTLDGQDVGTATTDAKGSVAVMIAVKKPSGIYKLRIEFAGDALYSPYAFEESVIVDGKKTTVYYDPPQVAVAGGSYVTGQDVTISTKVTTAPNGQGSPVVGLHALVCLPKLTDQGFADRWGGCDEIVSDAQGYLVKKTTLQVGGRNRAYIDLNVDAIRYVDGSRHGTSFDVAKSPTKIVASLPPTMHAPGHLDFEARVVTAATNKPVCTWLIFQTQPPGFPWGTVDQGFGCGPIKLRLGLPEAWNPGAWKVRLIVMTNNDGYFSSEAEFPLTVIVPPTLKTPPTPPVARP